MADTKNVKMILMLMKLAQQLGDFGGWGGTTFMIPTYFVVIRSGINHFVGAIQVPQSYHKVFSAGGVLLAPTPTFLL